MNSRWAPLVVALALLGVLLVSLPGPAGAGVDAPAAAASVYRYSAANLAAIAHEPDQAVTASGFAVTLPANSITLFVISPAVPLTPRLYLPLAWRS